MPGNGAAWRSCRLWVLITASSASWLKYAIEMGVQLGVGAINLRSLDLHGRQLRLTYCYSGFLGQLHHFSRIYLSWNVSLEPRSLAAQNRLNLAGRVTLFRTINTWTMSHVGVFFLSAAPLVTQILSYFCAHHRRSTP